MSPHLSPTLSTAASIIIVGKSLTNGPNFAFTKKKKGMRSVVTISYLEPKKKKKKSWNASARADPHLFLCLQKWKRVEEQQTGIGKMESHL